MAWGWDSSSSSSRRRGGGGGDGSEAMPAAAEGGERCSTRRVVKSRCRTEEVEDGRLVRKCEKTEQILRDCVGRPVEVIESNTELTEEDVTDQMTDSSTSFETSGLAGDIFTFPGLRTDIEAIQRSMFGSLGHFLQAAEEMTDELMGSLGMPSSTTSTSSSSSRRSGESAPAAPRRQVPVEGKVEKDAYADLAGQLKDV